MHSKETKYKAIVHYNHFVRSLRKVAKIYNVSPHLFCNRV